MKLLRNLAFALACLSGVVLLVAALVTIASVVGRNFLDVSFDGDTEIVAALGAGAVALFLPWCQFTKGNIIVDFFTSKCSPKSQLVLDRAGAALLALVLIIVAYRTGLGALSAWKSGAGSMLIGIPDWLVQASFLPGLVLTAIIAAAQAVSGNALAEVQA